MKNWDIDVSNSENQHFSELLGGLTDRLRAGISAVRTNSSAPLSTRADYNNTKSTNDNSGVLNSKNTDVKKSENVEKISVILADGSKIPSSYIKSI